MLRQEIVKWLTEQGYCFTELTQVSEGEYAVEDSDWNYKDVAHLHYVHALAEQLPFVLGRPVKCAVHLQKIFTFWLPMLNVSYDSEKFRQVYIFTLLSFIVIAETHSEAVGALKTRVTTRYSIGSPKLLFFVTPLLKWMIARNYRELMKDDIPMRERRGALRKLGYTFRMNGENYGFTDTLNNMESRLQLPPVANLKVSCRYMDLFASGPEQYIGDIGLLGFRLVRDRQEVAIFFRACPHEGASLDHLSCASGVITCPWHGRRLRPIAKFGWGQDANLVGRDYRVQVAGGELTIERLIDPPPLSNPV